MQSGDAPDEAKLLRRTCACRSPVRYLSPYGASRIMPGAQATQHLDRVHAVVDGERTSADGAVSASWRRSASEYDVDAASDSPPRILTAGELRDYRERVEKLIAVARDELDSLYRVVR